MIRNADHVPTSMTEQTSRCSNQEDRDHHEMCLSWAWPSGFPQRRRARLHANWLSVGVIIRFWNWWWLSPFQKPSNHIVGLGLSSKSNYKSIGCEGFGPLDRCLTLGCKEVRLDTFTQCKSFRSQNFMQRIPAKLLHHRSQAQNDWRHRWSHAHETRGSQRSPVAASWSPTAVLEPGKSWRVRCSCFNWRLSTSPKLTQYKKVPATDCLCVVRFFQLHPVELHHRRCT